MLQFLRLYDLQHTGFDRLKIVELSGDLWTCIFEAAGSKVEGNVSYNYRFHNFIRFK